ncbi:MAG: hypothetical protein EZS28_004439 [Streblomastix strix]|uniref:Uncharacterized protein n=1 Tax=Streblomastix strix TaxID=222440 RepID=A0A5J4WYP5_9EUKA|nr:MAG: hypothetical protein EZS28_004439 [Streblomastix strix]
MFEAAKRQGEFYLMRYVDEERICIMSGNMNASFEDGDCVAEWEDIENEKKKRNEVVIVQNKAETLERDSNGRFQLKLIL